MGFYIGFYFERFLAIKKSFITRGEGSTLFESFTKQLRQFHFPNSR